MATNKPSAGRPPFTIDPIRLRKLREGKGWTQRELAERVYTKIGKGNHTQLESRKTSYQRWERTGKIDPKTAKVLADELGVTVSVLCGGAPEAPPSRIDEIQARIHEQLVAGNEALARHLERDEEPSTAERDLAQRLAADLEYAQLSQDTNAFKRLSQLLSYSISELQQPIGVHGHWMLICSWCGLLSPPEIINGISGILSRVETLAQQFLKIPESDARITLTRDSVWFRIQFSHPRIPARDQSLSFVRCQASETGLLWTKPTWRDDYWIENLPERLCQYANYIRVFDQPELGPSDLANLKLAIYRLPTSKACKEAEEQGRNAPSTLVKLTNVCLDEYRGYLSSFLSEGFGHDAVTNWLCSDLMEVMQPLLQDWPLKYWKFMTQRWSQGGRIVVQLDAPSSLAAKHGCTDYWGNIFSIELVESVDGNVHHVPWRFKSVETTLETIQGHLKCELDKLDTESNAPPLSHNAISNLFLEQPGLPCPVLGFVRFQFTGPTKGN